jgi:hypothetical protein
VRFLTVKAESNLNLYANIVSSDVIQMLGLTAEIHALTEMGMSAAVINGQSYQLVSVVPITVEAYTRRNSTFWDLFYVIAVRGESVGDKMPELVSESIMCGRLRSCSEIEYFRMKACSSSVLIVWDERWWLQSFIQYMIRRIASEQGGTVLLDSMWSLSIPSQVLPSRTNHSSPDMNSKWRLYLRVSDLETVCCRKNQMV